MIDSINIALERARELAAARQPLAASLPVDASQVVLELLITWLHSEDVGTVLGQIGYGYDSRGRHDVSEHVAIASARRLPNLSPWYTSYLDSLPATGELDVGFFNPHLIGNMHSWRPGMVIEDGVGAHRLSMHHDGDPSVGWDPLESAVNVLCHRREHRYGIRRAPRTEWHEIDATLADPKRAMTLFGSEICIAIGRDVRNVIERLEREGAITPWHLLDLSADP